MSKFKVGDKVWCNGEIKVIARIDEWADNEFGYYFDKNDELLDFYEEHDLELYKSPHERLLELGWEFVNESKLYITYQCVNYYNKFISFIKEKKVYYIIGDKHIDLQLAEVLVDYLKELENG